MKKEKSRGSGLQVKEVRGHRDKRKHVRHLTAASLQMQLLFGTGGQVSPFGRILVQRQQTPVMPLNTDKSLHCLGK